MHTVLAMQSMQAPASASPSCKAGKVPLMHLADTYVLKSSIYRLLGHVQIGLAIFCLCRECGNHIQSAATKHAA